MTATISSAMRHVHRLRRLSPLTRAAAPPALPTFTRLMPTALHSHPAHTFSSTPMTPAESIPAVDASVSTTTVSPPSPSATFVPRFSSPVSPRSLTTTTAALWALRRSPLPSPSPSPSSPSPPTTPPIPTLSSSSSIYPRHPRFESMDKQLHAHLTHLTSLASTRPYLLPSDSSLSILLPLSSSPTLYDQYVRFDGGVRFEKILEDLDAFAANVAHLHILLGSSKDPPSPSSSPSPSSPRGRYLPPSDVMLVTASVDSIVMQRRFPMDRDVVMRGRVTWVGTSSLEVIISIYALEEEGGDSGAEGERGVGGGRGVKLQPLGPPAPPPGTSPDRWEKTSVMVEAERAEEEGEEVVDAAQLPEPSLSEEGKVLDAVFLMVARSVETGKAAQVCPLSVEHMTEEEVQAWQQGERNRERRKRDQERSLVRSPPTDEEVALLHALLMPRPPSSSPPASHPSHPSSSSPSTPPAHSLPGATIRPKSCSMSSTSMTSSSMTQPQERNTNGKIFGGSLMRGAYELARTCAYVYGGPGSRPYLVASDVITFLRPVEIGSVIEYKAKVVYAVGVPAKVFQVRVETEVRGLVSGERFVSNTFQFSFQCEGVPLRRVEPTLYSEAMEWLEGRRLLLQLEERKRRENEAKDAQAAEEVQGAAHAAESINEQGTQVHN